MWFPTVGVGQFKYHQDLHYEKTRILISFNDVGAILALPVVGPHIQTKIVFIPIKLAAVFRYQDI